MNCEGSQLLYMSFNQDLACFACGTSDGFRIFSTYPARESFCRVMGAGIGIVEMLNRCNLLLLVGGGKNPRFPLNKVLIWDDHKNKCVGELVFKSPVRAVKVRKDRIIVALQSKVYVYRFSDLKLLDQIITSDNPKGIISVCYSPAAFTIVMLGVKSGEIFIKEYDSTRERLVIAHNSAIACLSINSEGRIVASASEKGTLIRLWDAASGTKLGEYRRGSDIATILCIVFDNSCRYLACSSDKGTTHMFKLPQSFDLKIFGSQKSGDASLMVEDSQKPILSKSSKLNRRSSMKYFLPSFLLPKVPYLDSEWSFIQLRGLGRSISGFNSDSTKITILCANATAVTYTFSPEGRTFRDNSTKLFTSFTFQDKASLTKAISISTFPEREQEVSHESHSDEDKDNNLGDDDLA